MSDVLVRVEGRLGRLTLNRPRALNALTHDMVRTIDAALAGWADDGAVHAVLVDGAGERGLCAGGDIRALYDAVPGEDLSVPQAFFRDEYRMNARIARFPKPYVAFMDGIVMGGGIGISAHGSDRVVTERSRLAMPETGIGFVPDVGGTWLLARAPGQLGVHAGLTAAQIGAADAILCGLADVFVPSARLGDLASALAGCAGPGDIRACIAGFSQEPPPGVLETARRWIANCYAHDSVEAIVDALGQVDEPAAQSAAQEIGRKSPTSLKITLRALRTAPGLGSLEASLEQEFRLAMACLRRPDFREGVRAALVDKDRNPAWSPDTLEGVSAAAVDGFFAASDFGGLGLAGHQSEQHGRV